MPPGLAATFQDVSFRSHRVLFVGAMQLFSGALLLANRYVPLALTIAGGILFNIVAYHVTITPVGLPLACVAASGSGCSSQSAIARASRHGSDKFRSNPAFGKPASQSTRNSAPF